MAFQVINDPNRSLAASLGSALGGGLGSGLSGFGSGFGSSLEQLAANKVQDIKDSKLENLLIATGNYSPEEAKLAVKFGQMKGANPLEAAQMFQRGKLEQGEEGQAQRFEKPLTAQQREQNIHQIRQENLAELKPLAEAVNIAEQAIPLLKRALKKIKSGKVKTGILPGITPNKFLKLYGKETEEVSNALEDYLTLRSQALKGNVGAYRVKQLEKGKPGLHMSQKALEETLENEIKKWEPLSKVEKIKQDIIKENKGFEPRGLHGKIKTKLTELYPEEENNFQPSVQTGKQVSSVDPKSIPIGKKAIDPKTNENYYWDGNKFIPEKEWIASQGVKNA